MRAFLTTLVAFAMIVACGVVESKSASGGVKFYKYAGSVQCSGGGKSLRDMERELAGAGILALSSACGTDGNIHAAVCGAADGRIGIFTIPAIQAHAAAKLGFAPLDSLPAAAEVACP